MLFLCFCFLQQVALLAKLGEMYFTLMAILNERSFFILFSLRKFYNYFGGEFDRLITTW